MRQILVTTIVATLLLVPFKAGARGQPRPPDEDADGLARIGPANWEIVVRTGGELYFTARDEAATSADAKSVMYESVSSAKRLAREHGNLATGRKMEVAVQVPPGWRYVRFYAFVQKKDAVAIIRPDGTRVAAGERGVELPETRHMAFARISNAAPGVWKVIVSGRGMYLVTAAARRRDPRDYDLFFAFVEPGGRWGPLFLFPTRMIPAADTEVTCQVKLDDDVATAAFTFEDEDGRVIHAVDLGERGPSSPFVGPCRVPREPFRFVARGANRAGKAFVQRTSVMESEARSPWDIE